MANQYTLDNDFSAIVETQGTLYNPSSSNIELASAADTVKGKGIIFHSGATQTFRGTLYARSMDSAATLNVSDFTEGAGGGDVSDVRRPSTAYDVGALVDGAGLASGLVLRCTTAGTTSSAALDCSGYGLGDTITDGTAVWLVTKYVTLDANGGIPTDIYIPGAFNKKVTFTSSGTFTAPVTGTYRITVKGGGAGGQGGSSYSNYGRSGDGGGEGGTSIEYKYLSAGTTLTVTIGAGGSGGAKASEAEGASGTVGGNSTVSDGTFTITGGGGGQGVPFHGGDGTIPGAAGQRGAISTISSYAARGGNGGGSFRYDNTGAGGGGGNGAISSSSTGAGGAGKSGYCWIEYYDPTI